MKKNKKHIWKYSILPSKTLCDILVIEFNICKSMLQNKIAIQLSKNSYHHISIALYAFMHIHWGTTNNHHLLEGST